MKRAIAIVVVIAVLGVGGWLIYDKIPSRTTNVTADTAGSSAAASQPANGRTLDLRNQGLTKVGPEVYNSTDVTTLILSGNNLTTLPSEMGRMTKLEVLKLDHNRLDNSLIGEIRKMPLTTLDVSHNRMTGMPAEIGQLNKLETLDYSYNNLTGLPNELANLKNNLKAFNLTGNPLTPETITKIKSFLPHTTILF